MSEAEIRCYAESRGFHPATVERWLGWSEKDRTALLRLALGLKMGENHVRDCLDWLEEVSIRDGKNADEILSCPSIRSIETDPRLGRADKLKRVKEELRRLRYPRLSAAEDFVAARIRDLGLPRTVRISAPQGLEGGKLRVDFEVSSVRQMEEIAAALTRTARQAALAAIFAVLHGEAAADAERGAEPTGKHDASS